MITTKSQNLDRKKWIVYKNQILSRYNKKIEGDVANLVLGVILFVAGAVLTFMGFPMLGIPLMLAGLMLILSHFIKPPEQKIRTQERGLPTYSGLNADPTLYGSNQPIVIILGVIKVGGIIKEKRVFGDFNSLGFYSQVICDIDGFFGILGEYLNEKPIFLVNGLVNEKYDRSITETYSEVVINLSNINRYYTSGLPGLVQDNNYLITLSDYPINNIIYLGYYFIMRTEIQSGLTPYPMHNIFISTPYNNNYSGVNLTRFIMPSQSPAFFQVYNQGRGKLHLHFQFDRPINMYFNIISIYTIGNITLEGSVRYSNTLYNYTQSSINDIPDTDLTEIRLSTTLSLYSINNYDVFDMVKIPIYGNGYIGVQPYAIVKVSTTFSAGSWNATFRMYMINIYTNNRIMQTVFRINGVHNKNNCGDACSAKHLGGTITVISELPDTPKNNTGY